MTENGSEARDGIAAACDRTSTAFAVLAGLGFLASVPLAGSGGHTTAITVAVALGGASLLCGGLSGLRYPEGKIGDSVPSPGVATDGTIRSRSGALAAAKLYAVIGALLVVGGGYVALATL